MRASQPTYFFFLLLPLRSWYLTLIHLARCTGPLIPGKLRQPSTSCSWPSLRSTISGFTSTVSKSHFFSSPSGLNTIRRTFLATCGAARPTPCATYMSLSMFLDSAFSSSSNSVISSFLARKAGWGYLTIRSPATSPGSTSSSTASLILSMVLSLATPRACGRLSLEKNDSLDIFVLNPCARSEEGDPCDRVKASTEDRI
mmetsp:Transcript_11439/g.18836  ORF Transcript_11439/g.18836 Transcript_11439/m.18836 type:complete len:200 (+) Transcript_11439:481-1080(+)